MAGVSIANSISGIQDWDIRLCSPATASVTTLPHLTHFNNPLPRSSSSGCAPNRVWSFAKMNSDGLIGAVVAVEGDVGVGVGLAGEGGLNVNVGNGDTSLSFNLISILPSSGFQLGCKVFQASSAMSRYR